jgi:hypothetical protein
MVKIEFISKINKNLYHSIKTYSISKNGKIYILEKHDNCFSSIIPEILSYNNKVIGKLDYSFSMLKTNCIDGYSFYFNFIKNEFNIDGFLI